MVGVGIWTTRPTFYPRPALATILPSFIYSTCSVLHAQQPDRGNIRRRASSARDYVSSAHSLGPAKSERQRSGWRMLAFYILKSLVAGQEHAYHVHGRQPTVTHPVPCPHLRINVESSCWGAMPCLLLRLESNNVCICQRTFAMAMGLLLSSRNRRQGMAPQQELSTF
jgi:hypothetical protein